MTWRSPARVLRLFPPVLLTLQVLPTPPLQAAEGRLSDPQAEALARQALVEQDPAQRKAALQRLQAHRFKSSRAPEREFVLYAQGVLEDRSGLGAQAVQSFRKLERGFPRSPYLGEAQLVLGQEASDRKRYKEAEERARRAIVADLPVETKRRAQELLLWALAEQGRAAEGAEVLKGLHPAGAGAPSEKGLVGILETLCALKDRAGAESTRRSYQTFHPAGALAARVELDWALLLGGLEDSRASADVLQKLIQDRPDAPEADEARLALATLLSEGRLPPQVQSKFADPAKLLSELRQGSREGAKERQVLLVQMRLHLAGNRFPELLDCARRFRSLQPGASESATEIQLRSDALRRWTRDLLAQGQPGPLLPYLDRQALEVLAPEQRRELLRLLAAKGLASAARQLAEQAPARERADLIRTVAAAASPQGEPRTVLELVPARGGGSEALRRAQALRTLGDWSGLRAALRRTGAAPGRVDLILALLRRPPEAGEAPAARLKEAEAWLPQVGARESGREALQILVADLRVRAGRWKEALALYPASPQASRGWVALMRATCQLRLGQRQAAQATLKAAAGEQAFAWERKTLAQQAGIE